MPLDLLVIGNCSIDQYLDVDDSMVMHEPGTAKEQICFLHGSKIPVLKFKNNLAGNACHVSIGAQRLGLKTAIYTVLGADGYGNNFKTKFEEEGVNTKYVEESGETDVHAIIWHANDRTIFSYHAPRKYNLDIETIEKPKWIYYTSLAKGFEKFQERLCEYLEKNPDIVVCFNPGTMQLKAGISELKKMLIHTSVLFVNKEEAYKITQLNIQDEIELEQLHKKLQKLGPTLTVITDGKKGASAYDGEKIYNKTPPKITKPVVDKTGAGDSFATAFMAALHYKKPIQEALEWGTKNSVNTLGYVGCLDGLLTKGEIERN